MSGELQREHGVARLAVHVIKADSLWDHASVGVPGDTQAHVTVFQRDGVVSFKTTSRIARRELVPEWSLVSVIDIADEDPLDCCISLQVRRLPPLHLGFRKTLCAYYAPLRSLLNLARSSTSVRTQASQGWPGADSGPEGLSEPFWLNCQSKGRQKGRLLVRVQFISRLRVRPLKVLAVTWNMGNAPPSASFSKCFPANEAGAYDLIVVGTQESASVPRGLEGGLEGGHSQISSPGQASPTAAADFVPAASPGPLRQPPYMAGGDTGEEHHDPDPRAEYLPVAAHAHTQIDMSEPTWPMSPGSSASAPAAYSQRYPKHVPRARGHGSHVAAAGAMPVSMSGHKATAARQALAVLSEPDAIELVPLATSRADQIFGGSIPEGDEEEEYSDGDVEYIDDDAAPAAGPAHAHTVLQQHASSIPQSTRFTAVPPGDEEDDLMGGEEMDAEFQGRVGDGDLPPGFQSELDHGALSEDEMPEHLLHPSSVPGLVMPGKHSVYVDYGRDSARGRNVPALRMPVVHEEGESIAGSSNLGEEQPPAPGAVSVSGRQVTETGEVLARYESISSPGETNTLQLEEPFAEAQKPAHTHHPARAVAQAAAAAASHSTTSASAGPGTAEKEESSSSPSCSVQLQPTEKRFAAAYGPMMPKSLPAKSQRAMRAQEAMWQDDVGGLGGELCEDVLQAPLKKRRFSDSNLGEHGLKQTVAQRARAWVDEESAPALQQLLQVLKTDQEQLPEVGAEGGASQVGADPALGGLTPGETSYLTSDLGGPAPTQGTSTDRSKGETKSGYKAEQSYISVTEPWGDVHTPSYATSSQEHTPLDTASQPYAASAELSTEQSSVMEAAAAGSIMHQMLSTGCEETMSLEIQGMPELPYTPFGAGAPQAPSSGQQSSPTAPAASSTSAVGSSSHAQHPDSLTATEITLRQVEGPIEAVLSTEGSVGTPLSSPRKTISLCTSTSSRYYPSSTPPLSQAPSHARTLSAETQGVHFSSVHVVWPQDIESSSPMGDSGELSPALTHAQLPSPLPPGPAGRHLDGDDVDVDPDASFSSDSSWATGATPRHVWTPRVVPERSMSMPDLPPEPVGAAVVYASHAQPGEAAWPWQTMVRLGTGPGSAPGTPTGGREMEAIERQRQREATTATASSVFDKALREEDEGPSGSSRLGRGRGGPWSRGAAPGAWKRMQAGSPRLPLRPPTSIGSDGTADRSRGMAWARREGGTGHSMGSSKGMYPVSPMSPSSAAFHRAESAASTIIQDFDRAVTSSTDIGEIYETVMQHACAGAIVARAREVGGVARDPAAAGAVVSPFSYLPAPDSQQSGASVGGPLSVDSHQSARAGPARPPPGGGVPDTQDGPPGFRSRGGAAEADSGSSITTEPDLDGEPAQAPEEPLMRFTAAAPAEPADRFQRMAVRTNFGPHRPVNLQQLPQRRASDSAGTATSHSSSLPDSSEAYFGVPAGQQPQYREPAAPAHSPAKFQTAPRAVRVAAGSRTLSRTESSDITPRLHGLPAAVAAHADAAEALQPASASSLDMQGAASGAQDVMHGSLEFWSDEVRSTAFTTTSFAKRVNWSREQDSARSSGGADAREVEAPAQPSSTSAAYPPQEPLPTSAAFPNPPSSGSSSSQPPSYPSRTTAQPHNVGSVDLPSSGSYSTDRPQSDGAPQVRHAAYTERRRFFMPREHTVSSVDTVRSISESTLQPASVNSASGPYHSRYPLSHQTAISSSASVHHPQSYYTRGDSSSGNPWSQGRSQGIEASSAGEAAIQPSVAELARQFGGASGPGSGSTGSASTAPTFAAGVPDQKSKKSLMRASHPASIPSLGSDGKAARSSTSARGASTDTQQTRSTAVGTDSLLDMPYVPSDMSMSGALPDSAAGATGATLANWVGSGLMLEQDASRLAVSPTRSFSHSFSHSQSTHSLSHSNGAPALPSDGSMDPRLGPSAPRGADTLQPRSSGDSGVQLGSAWRSFSLQGAPDVGAAGGHLGDTANVLHATADRSQLGQPVAAEGLLRAVRPSQIPIRPGSDLARYSASKHPIRGGRAQSAGIRGAGSSEGAYSARGRSTHGRHAHSGRESWTSGGSLRATSTTGTHTSQPLHSLSSEVMMPFQPPFRGSGGVSRGGRPSHPPSRMTAANQGDEQAQLDVASMSASSVGGSTTVAMASSASGGMGIKGMMGARTHAFIGDQQLSDRLEPTHQRSLFTPSQRAAEHWSRPADIRARAASPSRQVPTAAPIQPRPGSPAAAPLFHGSPSHSQYGMHAPLAPPGMPPQPPQMGRQPQDGAASAYSHPSPRHHGPPAANRESPSSPAGPSLHAPAPVAGAAAAHRGARRPQPLPPQPLHISAVSRARPSPRGGPYAQQQQPLVHSQDRVAALEGSVTFEGAQSPPESEASPRTSHAWYSQPRSDRSSGYQAHQHRAEHHADRAEQYSMHAAAQQLTRSRSGASYSGRAADAHGPVGGTEEGGVGGAHSRGSLPAWTRRSLSLSQTGLRLGELQDRVSRHSTVEQHASDESDVEVEVARGPAADGEGASAQPLQAPSGSNLLTQMKSGLRMARGSAGPTHPQPPQQQHGSSESSGVDAMPARSGHRRTGSGQSPSFTPTTAPITLVDANELQSALRSVASTIDSMHGAPVVRAAPLASHPVHIPQSPAGMERGSAGATAVGGMHADRGPPEGVQDYSAPLSTAADPNDTQSDIRSLRRQTIDQVPWPEAVAAAVNSAHAASARPGPSHSAFGRPPQPAQPRYKVWKHVSMGQMRLVVLASTDMHMLLGNAAAATVATGVAGVGSNKGAVAISCQVWGNELCFVNAHLAAHQSRVRERNKMYRTIAKELRMRATSESLLSSFHHVFFMGDLNYRLDYGHGSDFRDEGPNDSLLARFQQDLMHAHNHGEYSTLLQMDQLRRMQEVGHAFVDFHEAEVQFAPTYKVEREASIVYKSRRLPAWCDRILWHSNLPADMRPRCARYFMAGEVETSDHKPVGGIFVIPSVNSPAQVVTDDTDNFVLVLTGLKAEGLLEEKMKLKRMSRIRTIGCSFPQLRPSTSIRLRARGDDFHHQGKTLSPGVGTNVEWRGDVKMHCKHAYTEHIRGRMLHFKVSYDAGSGRTRRTIGQAALPLMSVLPKKEQLPAGWPQGHSRDEWPFSVPLYHAGLRAGRLTGIVKWSLRRTDSMARLAHMRRAPGAAPSAGPALTLSPSGHLTEASTNPGAARSV